MAERDAYLAFPKPQTETGKGYWTTNSRRKFRPKKFFWTEPALDRFDERIRDIAARLPKK